MMAMMEATTTIDLAGGGETSTRQETSIDEIHIETTDERLILFLFFN